MRLIRIAVAICLCLLLAVLAGAASAAAAPAVDDVSVEDDESWIGVTDEHEIRIEASNVNTTDGPATVSVELSGWPDDALAGEPDVTVSNPSVEHEGGVRTDGTTIEFDVNDTSLAPVDFVATVDVALEHPRESSRDGATYEIRADVADTAGSASATAGMTLKRLSYVVDGRELSPDSSQSVHRNRTVTVKNLDPGSSYTLYKFNPDEGGLGDPITSVDSGGATSARIDTGEDYYRFDEGWYIVSDGQNVAPIKENAFRLQTGSLQARQLDGTVDSTGEGSDTAVRIDSSSRSKPFDVYVTSEQLDASELFGVFEGRHNSDVRYVYQSDTKIVIRNVKSGEEIPMTFRTVQAATYDFEFEMAETKVTDTTSVSVEERDIAGEFGSDRFEAPAGSIAEIDLSLENADEAYVMLLDEDGIGGSGPKYVDVLYVQGDSTIQINTRLLGTNVPASEAYVADSGLVTSYYHNPDHPAFDDLPVFRSQLALADISWPIQPGRYRLVAGASPDIVVRDDGTPDFRRPIGRSNLVITDTEGLGNVTTYVAPEGSANEFEGEAVFDELEGDLTERRTVAKGDRLVFEIEAEGITGLVSWLDTRLGTEDVELDHETLSKLLDFPDGVSIDAERTDSAPDEPVARFDLGESTDGDLYVVHEPITEDGESRVIERYYLVVDTRGTGLLDREMSPGEYRFEFGYEATGRTGWLDDVDHDRLEVNGAAPHFPYYGPDADGRIETRLVTVEERTVEYNQTDSRDRPVVRNVSEATIAGRTNLAPGTELSVQVNTAESTAISAIDDVDVAEDGTFAVTHDLSGLSPGETLAVELYLDQRLFDERTAVVAPPDGDLSEYVITDTEDPIVVAPNGTASNASATIENTGYLPGRGTVELSVEGETLDEQFVEIDEDTTEQVRFSGDTGLSPGEYTYTIATNDDEVTGQLTVPGSGGETVASQNSSESPDDSPEDPDNGFFGVVPPLPIGPRHAVGGAAVVGAVHVLGYWG